MKTTVAIVDDHHLLAQALAGLVNRFDAYQVIFCAENGHDLLQQIPEKGVPDIILLDVNMPGMNGSETAGVIRDYYPSAQVLALSMFDDEQNVVTMMQNGARGYLLKGSRPDELLLALNEVRDRGSYNTTFVTERLLSRLNNPVAITKPKPTHGLNDRELTFVKHACSELTYVEIADRMCVSPRTVDGYREAVFEKLGVKSRQGLVMEAIRRGLAG
ncbi:response regulator transcription factor [Fibrella forsythiae]|uniref:Response regulator transcription factor n=1 Tax=Fibrella forsythiae TaxID=2817061 RepID=A0ABS3JNK0_9BACT|nr:response regulator transcription factor [Fibrella forsythiae]MBO0950986.1 response regulator transcription factor [Fibrella forsythiae]